MEINIETRTKTNRDWAGLLPDLLHLITQKFNDLPDLIYFRAVCKSWHSSAMISEPLPLQVPWIVEEHHDLSKCKRFRFFSPISEKFYEVKVPAPPKSSFQGIAQDGYFLIYDHDRMEHSVVNPLTKHVIGFPKFTSLHMGCDICYRGEYSVPFQSHNSFLNPLQGIYHVGDDKWVKIPGVKSFASLVHNKGMYLFSDADADDTTIFNIATHTVTGVIPPPTKKNEERRIDRITLVESGGEILRVQKMDSPYSKTIYFNIYRLNFENETKNSYWVKIDNIGDRVLFLSEYFATYGIMFEARRCPGLRRNSIYFRKSVANGNHCFCRYDISNGELENKDCGFRFWDVFVPSLQNLSCSSPVNDIGLGTPSVATHSLLRQCSNLLTRFSLAATEGIASFVSDLMDRMHSLNRTVKCNRRC